MVGVPTELGKPDGQQLVFGLCDSASKYLGCLVTSVLCVVLCFVVLVEAKAWPSLQEPFGEACPISPHTGCNYKGEQD